MKFAGEHLLPGQLGHFFVIFSLLCAAVAAFSFYRSFRSADLLEKANWLRTARVAFLLQFVGIIVIFTTLFYICANHYFEYMYAYKHASKELEPKYLLACIWEGQEGSFLLWAGWQALLGLVLIRKANKLEAPVMTVFSVSQVFLLLMILGVYIGNIKIGNSPFTLTRNEITGPIFGRPDYLSFIKDGLGLNVLLRNYWMVIHPPILFLGFALTLVPFSYAVAALKAKEFSSWVPTAIKWSLVAAGVLGVGIMMGGKWAYGSLNFGGYWAWDPVENASLIPWLLLVAGLHTLVIYKATGHSLKAAYFFAILAFIFVLYSSFLTRTGILGDTSVHSFTETGDDIAFSIFGWGLRFKAMNALIFTYLLSMSLPALWLLIRSSKHIPSLSKEEDSDSREFWMFIGSLVLFLTGLFIIAKTSVPVYNKLFGTSIAPPADVEFSYNKIAVLIAIIIGMLTAVTQYFKYKSTSRRYVIKKLAWPTVVAAVVFTLVCIFAPFEFYKHGAGFRIAIYAAAFASIYSVIANAFYIWSVQKGKLINAGGAIAHAGFALMITGMLISSANKKVISSSMVNGITFAPGKDPMTKQEDNPRENLTLIRQMPSTLADYKVTYLDDSLGHEKGRRFYKLLFEKNTENKAKKESFVLLPDVYQMKDNNMSSNPATKNYLFRDIFTYVSYAINEDERDLDTASFREVLLKPGDTAFYGNGLMILTDVSKADAKPEGDFMLTAHLDIVSKDSMHYHASPRILIDSIGLINKDDTVYAQNLYLRFAGVQDDKIKLGIKESDRLIDFVTVKAYEFPMINLVWLGIVVMIAGMVLGFLRRSRFNRAWHLAILVVSVGFVFYMFLLAD